MSFLLDDTAVQEPVKDISQPLRAAQDVHNARVRVDVSRVSRKELEDNFLQLHDESLLLKQHIHQQEDKIRKLGTKLLRLVKDRRRMEQLAGGGGAPMVPRRWDAEKEDLVDEFKEKVRALETDNDKLRQRLFVAKQQQQLIALSPAARSSHTRVQTRAASAPRKPDDASSPSPTGQPTAYLHALLEEAREKSRNLENVIESQQRRIAQLEEEKNVTLQQSQINNNVTMIKLQKQLAERCNAMVELEERFLQLQEGRHCRCPCLPLPAGAHISSRQQLEERVDEVEQEKELLKEHNEKLMLDGSQQQRWSVQERQLQQHIAQLEQALQGDLQDKKKILEEVKAERDACENLTEENRKLVHQLAEKKREIEELQRRFLTPLNCWSLGLPSQCLPLQAQKSQQSGELGFLQEGQDGGMREHADAHVETIHELEKVRQLLAVESRISSDLKVDPPQIYSNEHQLFVYFCHLDAKMHKLEAQLRDVAYGAKSVSAQDRDQSPALEDGENLVELQIIGATLSAAALEALGDPAPSTFCTYAFYLFDLHATPVATGPTPHYGFTSQYVVSVDRGFLEYVRERRLCVEMHQALGLRWKTMATAALDLRRLLRDGAAAGTLPLVGNYGEDTSFGSLEYWIKLRNPIAESDRLVVTRCLHGCSDDACLSKMAAGVEKELLVEVRGCSGLQSRCSSLPSPYVVYKLFHFPDYPTSTVHDCCQPRFADMKSFRLADDGALEHYLASEALNLYVFDYKEPQMDEYLGKAAVPLAALLQDQEIAGTFDLHDSSGRHVGHIDLAIKWKLPVVQSGKVLPPSQKSAEAGGGRSLSKRHAEPSKLTGGGGEQVFDAKVATLAPTLTPAKKPPSKDEQVAKRVTFQEAQSVDVSLSAGGGAAESASRRNASEWSQSDSDDDDGIVHRLATQVSVASIIKTTSGRGGRSHTSHASSVCVQGLQRVRVEVACLSLEAESRLCRDVSVVRLFVEFSFLDMPTEETPVSLPKPPPGKSVSFNFSKGVCARASLRLIRFTVVSEPPEEEEQERECEDVGVAFLAIPDLLSQPDDVAHLDLRGLSASSFSSSFAPLLPFGTSLRRVSIHSSSYTFLTWVAPELELIAADKADDTTDCLVPVLQWWTRKTACRNWAVCAFHLRECRRCAPSWKSPTAS
uniref:RPGRIP1 like n=1 Tax=Hippocampus comes TaxID=109280 RepID=A0A3Q2XQI7_HIPCM